jgi:hypothetical protein
MFVCVYSVFVLSCVQVAALRRADPPSKESFRLCIGLGKLKRRPKPKKRAVEPIEEEATETETVGTERKKEGREKGMKCKKQQRERS